MSTTRPRNISTRNDDLHALLRRGLDLDEHQVALDEVLAADVVDLDDGDDLVELLANLLQLGVVAVDDEGHARQVRLLGLADGEAVDVEAARSEHAGDVGQHARLILHQRRQHVPHTSTLSKGAGFLQHLSDAARKQQSWPSSVKCLQHFLHWKRRPGGLRH